MRYNGRCEGCGHEQEVITTVVVSEGERLQEDCQKCGRKLLVKIPNQEGPAGFSGLSTPGIGKK